MTLAELSEKVSACQLCKLAKTRNRAVFGEGNPSARLMFIGEGPGRDEDASGRPFVGRAGQLLTRVIEQTMGLQRSDVYIANIVKCRPTLDLLGKKDRAPDEEEVSACAPYLREQIQMIRPKVIVTLGNPSTRFILKTKEGITKLRGNWFVYENIPVMPTYHPSFIIRSGGEKSSHFKNVQSDMQCVLTQLTQV